MPSSTEEESPSNYFVSMSLRPLPTVRPDLSAPLMGMKAPPKKPLVYTFLLSSCSVGLPHPLRLEMLLGVNKRADLIRAVP